VMTPIAIVLFNSFTAAMPFLLDIASSLGCKIASGRIKPGIGVVFPYQPCPGARSSQVGSAWDVNQPPFY